MKALGYVKAFRNSNEILDKNKRLYKQTKDNKFKKDRPLLEQIESAVFNRYCLYLDNQHNLDAITPIDSFKAYEDIMRKSYTNSKFFKTERKAIFDSLPRGRKTICPYCLISDSSTLDHYFPEALYAEYIIFTPNLIPCCENCNELKSKSIRKTIHFYFDDISQVTYLNISLSIDSGIPVINIELDPSTPPLLIKHFHQLNLIARYKEKTSDELTQILEMLCEAYSENNYDGLMDMFVYKISSLKRIYGSNYWKACLLEAVFKSRNEILQVIANESLKKHYCKFKIVQQNINTTRIIM